MFWRIALAVAASLCIAQPADARRVALVIGQNAYSGGASATIGLPKLDNPVRDARRMAELLGRHGFEVIACDGKTPGCLDLDRNRFLTALKTFEQMAVGADLALVFFAGHGMATEEGNILTPVDARVNCATGAVTRGVPVEQIMAATRPARHKLVILDACRDNPLGEVCPNLKGKKLAFTRIEAGAMQGFLLVTSTQFGQEALDGPPGVHSPFATALFTSLEASPGVYFEQVFNEVARATYEGAQKQGGFLQIPGKVVGGEAPADCLAGKGCVGDARMAALAVENERLTADASGVRNLLAAEEKTRGKPYTVEERKARVTELEKTLTSIGTSTDPLRQEARRLIDGGNISGGKAKLDEALDADEKAIAEAERVAADKRKAAARSARDLAVLASGTDVVKAVVYFQRATRLDPSDARTWIDYAEAALVAGSTEEAKTAFEQAALRAQDSNDPRLRYWATLGLGDVARSQGSLASARRLYETAAATAEPIAKSNPGNTTWQRDLSVSHNKIGDVLVAQGDFANALKAFNASLAVVDFLVKSNPGNTVWQRDVTISHNKIGDVLVAQGNLSDALKAFNAALAIRDRLVKADPGNAGWQRDLSVSHERIGDVLRDQGDDTAALESYRASLEIRERLVKSDPGNAGWQRDLSVSNERLGDVHLTQRNFADALDQYRTSLNRMIPIRDRDPSNADLQRFTSVTHNKVGDVLVADRDLYGALQEFNAGLVIAEHLVKADPGNAGWQRDLSVSQERVGAVLREQGNLPAALASYRASLTTRERLAKSDPGNARWQRDMSVSHANIGRLLARQGERDRALAEFRLGREILVKLKVASPNDAKDLAWFEGEIAALEKR
jgi:tetratricopeptide (TPR) repeat protein